jgi:hypothetical protein
MDDKLRLPLLGVIWGLLKTLLLLLGSMIVIGYIYVTRGGWFPNF